MWWEFSSRAPPLKKVCALVEKKTRGSGTGGNELILVASDLSLPVHPYTSLLSLCPSCVLLLTPFLNPLLTLSSVLLLTVPAAGMRYHIPLSLCFSLCLCWL